MNEQPTTLTEQQLDELETLAKNIPSGPWTVDDSRAELRGSHGNLLADLWDDRLGAYFAAMHDAALPLVAEVRRLRAPADRVRALAILEAADFLRDAHHRDGLTVQEIGTALRHTADEADPMVGSLARDGFGLDEIADMLSRPAVPAAVETGE